MIDLDELERLAKAAQWVPGVSDDFLVAGDLEARLAFRTGVTPTDVLALITELRTLRDQRHELAGVVADVEMGRGFDGICMRTIKRVIGVLGGAA
ncbi:hypothetical protein [Caballeronia sp. KNU42]